MRDILAETKSATKPEAKLVPIPVPVPEPEPKPKSEEFINNTKIQKFTNLNKN